MSSFGAHLEAVLSEREREVIRLTAQGLTDFAVGQELGLAAETVRSHWKRVRKRLGEISRAEVIRLLAQQEGNPYREVFENLQTPVGYADADGHYVDVNPALSELVGYSRDEMIGRSFRDFVPDEATPEFDEAWEDFTRTNHWEGNIPVVGKDHQPVEVYWRAIRVPSTGRIVTIGFTMK
jgi:PAS domain S-box-containing protein